MCRAAACCVDVFVLPSWPLFGKVIRVDVNERTPALRHRRQFVDRVDWADWQTCTTINADLRIDIVLFILFSGMNTIHRTNIDTRGVFLIDAGLGDYIRHGRCSLLLRGQHGTLLSVPH